MPGIDNVDSVDDVEEPVDDGSSPPTLIVLTPATITTDFCGDGVVVQFGGLTMESTGTVNMNYGETRLVKFTFTLTGGTLQIISTPLLTAYDSQGNTVPGLTSVDATTYDQGVASSVIVYLLVNTVDMGLLPGEYSIVAQTPIELEGSVDEVFLPGGTLTISSVP